MMSNLDKIFFGVIMLFLIVFREDILNFLNLIIVCIKGGC